MFCHVIISDHTYLSIVVIRGTLASISIHYRPVVDTAGSGPDSPVHPSPPDRYSSLVPLEPMQMKRCAFGLKVLNNKLFACGKLVVSYKSVTVLTLKFEQFGLTIQQCVQKMQIEWPWRCVYVWGVSIKIWKWYICATEGLKIGGLGPLLKMGEGGFQNWPTHEKKGFWSKNKETYFF